jgi:phenylalanyl-tRNA synthetase alpha chain
MAKGESLGVLTYGKVYRKDEIDSRHMNVFHQMDGYFIQPRSKGEITQKDLENVLSQVIETVFGKNTKYRFNKDTFPYTDPSLEVEVMIGEKWVEILGSGVIKGSVLEKLGVDSKQYTGWAF